MINPTGTNALNPFRARINRNAGSPGVAMGSYPNDYNADNARGMAHKGPLIIAGWGYDIFGRPAPSQAASLSALNAGSKTNSANYGFANNSGSLIDARGTPAPYGAEVPAEKYVAGALDVRYNQRHGVWQADPVFLGKITSVEKTTTNKNIYNIYGWEEVEITKDVIGGNAQDPINRAITVPAKGKAINLSELTLNIRDAVFQEVASGTIIELKSYLAPNQASDPDFTLKPIYIFNHNTTQNVFLRIEWNTNQGYPAPLSDADDQWTGATLGFCNRYLYKAEVVYFDKTHTDGVGASPWGGFKGYTEAVYTQAINLIEFGNPVGARGMVSPGVITVLKDGALSIGTPNLNWTGVVIPVGSKSAYPSGFSIKAISHNTIVEGTRLTGMNDNSVTNYGPVYYFSCPNAHDGSCSTGIWPFRNQTHDSGAGENTLVQRSN